MGNTWQIDNRYPVHRAEDDVSQLISLAVCDVRNGPWVTIFAVELSYGIVLLH